MILLHYLERIVSVLQMYTDLITMSRVIEFKQLIDVAKIKGHKQKAIQSYDIWK